MVKFLTCQSFGEAVIPCFHNSGKVTVDYWACGLEEHENTPCQHYHVFVKLFRPKRWNPVKNLLKERHNITVNFSENHEHYYSAFTYITKTDRNVYKSPNHPDLQEIGSPVTKKCMSALREKNCKRKSAQLNNSIVQNVNNNNKNNEQQQNNQSKVHKVKKLTNLDVSESLVANNIRSEDELFARACEQKDAGKKDLANFLVCKDPKSLQNLIKTTWRMQEASDLIVQSKTTGMELIQKNVQGSCIDGCNGQWLACAQEVLQNNQVHPIIFAAAMRDLLIKGTGKFRNIMIVGPVNGAETFLLSRLQLIYKTFSNPTNNKYAWLGLEKAEVIFLNYFRWSSEMISWKEMLLLLEGQIVHLPPQKIIMVTTYI